MVVERNGVSEYRKQLDAVCSRLSSETESAEIRGEGTAMFVFAQLRGRAVEVYCGENNEVLVEFWEAEGDAPSEDAYSSYDAATVAAQLWLLR